MKQARTPSSGRKIPPLSPIREDFPSPFRLESPYKSHVDLNHHGLESSANQNVPVQIGGVIFLAIIQIFIIFNLLNGSLENSSASIKISYSRQHLYREAATATKPLDLYSSSEIMNQAIADIASLHADSRMSLEQQIHREKALRAVFNADRHHELDPTLLCRSAALEELARHQQERQQQHGNTRRHGAGFYIPGIKNPPRDPYFEYSYSTNSSTAVPPIPSSSVILSTYFGSRVDPNRCFELKHGKLAQDDALHLLTPLIDAVERLDLTALVFHDGALSDEFLGNLSTDATYTSKNVYFQKVELQREEWSLADERWLIFSDWLRSPAAAEVEWVLALDLSTTTISSDPFDLMESSEWLFSLWTDTVAATPREVARFSHCYAHYQHQKEPSPDSDIHFKTAEEKYYYNKKGGRQEKEEIEEGDPMVAAGNAAPVFLKETDPTFNSAVIGGTKTAFLSLVYSVKEELERLQEERGGATAVWNCEKSVLHRVAKTAALQGQRVFTRGHPFVGDAEACTELGNCDYAIYREF